MIRVQCLAVIVEYALLQLHTMCAAGRSAESIVTVEDVLIMIMTRRKQMGKKYIIELEDEPIVANRVEYWQVKKFPMIFFSAEELNELEEYKPVKHKFVPGDIVMIKDASTMEAILTYVSGGMRPIYYMYPDGSCNKVLSSEELIFVRHEDCLVNFLDNRVLYF